jgi:hypothetical protein
MLVMLVEVLKQPSPTRASGGRANGALGQTIHVGWTAAYIGALEYGHSKQAPQGFVRIGCAQWPSIVASVSEEAKSRSGQ